MSTSEGRPIRVMQSFAAPRATTNPYIHMLDAALARTPALEHVRFSRRRALLGRYDVLHFHWPDTLFGGTTRARAVARRAFALALRVRLSSTRVAVVRTMHNVGLPERVTPWERRYLAWIDRRTDHRIVLNERTVVPPGAAATLIRHGHYRDWFAELPRLAPRPATIAFVGLVRPYKGVEELIEAFAGTAASAPELRLRIAGKPADARIEREVRERAGRDPRIELDLRYLSETDFANTVMQSAGVVLPYRAMHNSGAVLAALSLARPVLVPRSEVVEDLAREVGPGWITCFDGAITGDDLRGFAAAAERAPAAPPDLAARDWDHTGAAHRAAFQTAIAHRHGRARR